MKPVTSPSVALSDKSADKESALKTLAEYGRLQSNWDGYGAGVFDPETLLNCTAALNQIVRHTVCPDIAPNPNGTVSFDWNSENGSAHLEIGNERFNFLVSSKDCPSFLESGHASEMPDRIPIFVAAFVFSRPARGGETGSG